MRIGAWALVTLAGVACSRRSLQGDDGGSGSIGLDAAGGAIQNDAGLGAIDTLPPPIDAWSPPVDGQPSCGLATIVGERVATEMLLVLDRSVAGDQVGWRNLISTVVNQINASGAEFDWGLYTFPKDGPACGAATVSAGADLGFGSGATWHLAAHVAEAGGNGNGNGTPTAAAIGAGTAYLRGLLDQRRRFLMLVTDGAPTCAGIVGGQLSDDAAQAQADALTAIASASAEGFSTFVVAPSTTTAAGDVASLNALAAAGGYPRQGDIRFFTEATLAELFPPPSTTSCNLVLPSPPPAPDRVSVMLNGTSVPRDPQHVNGWDYTAVNRTEFSLYGSWCSMLLESRSFEIRVTYGCPIFPVP